MFQRSPAVKHFCCILTLNNKVHSLNTCIRLYLIRLCQHSQFSITLLININYWSVSKTAETSASRPRARPQVPRLRPHNFCLERSRDQDCGLKDYKTGMRMWCQQAYLHGLRKWLFCYCIVIDVQIIWLATITFAFLIFILSCSKFCFAALSPASFARVWMLKV